MVSEALKHYGLAEFPGTKDNNQTIMDMAKFLGIENLYPNDETAWCALFMCYICVKAGKPMPYKGYHILRAKSFENWGKPVPKNEAMLGDILVFTRSGGGHVGIYVGETEDDRYYYVLGGNQKNQVSIVKIEKSRCSAVRRFYATAAPASSKKYYLTSTGFVSKNEA